MTMLLQISPTNAVNSATDTLVDIQKKLVDFGTAYGMQVIGAIIILVIGLFAARWLGNALARRLEKIQMEPPVRTLLVRVVRLIVMAFVLVMVLDKFGVPIVTLVAGMGVAGVGVGLAMQGVLKNLFAGLTIIFTKPFRVGEYVEILNVYGQVQTIELFSTTLLHSDMSRVVIPNHNIVGEILHNYGNIRQLDLSVGVGYTSDLPDVLNVVREIVSSNPRVLKTPAPVVGIANLSGSSITIAVKPWTAVPDFSPAQAEIYQAIVDHFRTRKIEIPFPQREVRLLNNP
ncbi:MAG TPA: mechanosensitive ion channel domain-containing protein [Verrucomicrobiae bacterium]|jgi:small conductance mechanosensitive channel|nr:mechanosensitive ion channel domain-containing protein [Verrucomicrobiae bacterium]